MKKVFTLCMALLALSSMPAMAQDDNEEIDNTFQFYHAEINGNDTTWTQLHDGDVYTANVAEEDDFGFAQIMSGLYVRNISSDDATARVHMTIQDLPSGQIQFCMLGQCNMYNKIGEDNAKGGIIPAGNYDDMLLEWTDITSHGTATITLQVNPAVGRTVGFKTNYFDTGVGPKITVNFVYADPTGINSVNADSKNTGKVSAIYNLRGEQLSQLQKGVNIVRYADGTTKKIIE